MIPTRAGELMIGAILAIAFVGNFITPGSRVASLFIGSVGCFLIAGSFVFLSEESIFPGFRALPPTLGTGMLIYAGATQGSPIGSLLSAKPLVWIGLVSYSAYLWHWPLLAFFRYGFGSVGPLAASAIFLSTFVLAWLTYAFVERPTRRSRAAFRPVLVRQFVVPAGVVAALCLAVIVTHGYGPRSHSTKFSDLRPAYAYGYVCQKYLITDKDLANPRCVVGEQSGPKVDALLWGDSNAAHFIGVIGAFANAAHFSFRNVEHSSCPPLLGDGADFAEPKRQDDCARSLDAVAPLIGSTRTLIISASWPSYQKRNPEFLNRFFATIDQLVRNHKRVILIGKAPVFAGYDRKCLQKAELYPLVSCADQGLSIDVAVSKMNESLIAYAQRTQGVEYFDVTDAICKNFMCSPFDSSGRGLYFDSEHLSMGGSWRIGKLIVGRSGVPKVFQVLSHTWRGDAGPPIPFQVDDRR